MTGQKLIQNRNARVPLDNEELLFLKGLVDKELNKNQKFDKDRIYFLLKLNKKFEKVM